MSNTLFFFVGPGRHLDTLGPSLNQPVYRGDQTKARGCEERSHGCAKGVTRFVGWQCNARWGTSLGRWEDGGWTISWNGLF